MTCGTLSALEDESFDSPMGAGMVDGGGAREFAIRFMYCADANAESAKEGVYDSVTVGSGFESIAIGGWEAFNGVGDAIEVGMAKYVEVGVAVEG